MSTGFSVPWRDEQGLNISFAFAAQGAKRENGWAGFARASSASVSPGFFGTLGVPIARRPRLQRQRQGRRRARGDHQPERGQIAVPGQDPLNRELWWTDGVMKFIGISYEPRRIVGGGARLRRREHHSLAGHDHVSARDQEGWQGRLFVRAQQDPYAWSRRLRRRFTTCRPTSPWSGPARSRTFAPKC